MTDPTPQTTPTRDEAVPERPRIEPLLKDGDVVERLKQFRLRWQESGDLTYLGKALVDAVGEIEGHRRAILDLFAPILAEKELHHTTGERITRKDLNNAHRKGAEEGRLAAHLIDSVNSPLNACCYRDECRALEARALAAEAALKLVAEQDVTEIALDPDRPRRICAAAIRAQVNNEPGA